MEAFTPESHPHVVMPLGGLGTGNVGIGADGGLRQWQLQNTGNHLGEAPWSFFALRVNQIEPPLDDVRILQSEAVLGDRPMTPLVTDNVIPAWQRDLVGRVGGFTDVEMQACYPRAELTFTQPGLPLVVRQIAQTPISPIDVDASELPVVMFDFELTNVGQFDLHGWLGGTLHNAVGGDGVINPVGVAHTGYGGNTNRLRRTGWTKLIAENLSLPIDDPRSGQMVLAVDDPGAQAFLQWTDPQQFLDFLATRMWAVSFPMTPAQRRVDPAAVAVQMGSASHASPAGSTWCGGLVVPWWLASGESSHIRFALAWHFPNRVVNFEPFGPPQPGFGVSRFWLGNHYAARFADAEAVVDEVTRNWDELVHTTGEWCDVFTGSSLPPRAAGFLAAQPVALRSPTCFIDGGGRFFGFEGVQGASTPMWGGHTGGSCPMNCTHVWNYEQALAYLYPSLERSMRETELQIMQAPEGYVPHRVVAPTYLPQMWGVDIGGPMQPALDGMLGVILKTYREVRNGAGLDWLSVQWPSIVKLMSWVSKNWDGDGSGVLRGVQPSTHDIDLKGANSFTGTLWLAALRAYQEMALLLGEQQVASDAFGTFTRGSRAYDDQLWTGEYFRQVLEPGDDTDYQWGEGCLSDQLIGQWWAHELGLGYVLPQDHVRDALRSIVRYNLRRGFDGFEHPFRVYATGDDVGLLVCSWPHGGRPDVPTRYADEVWSGVEYQVAAHCLREGLVDEAQAILDAAWDRMDGQCRNPFNEIECGDHYARALSGWSVLRAVSGIDYDAIVGRLNVQPLAEMLKPVDGRLVLPLVVGDAWGSLSLNVSTETGGSTVIVDLKHGSLTVNTLRVGESEVQPNMVVQAGAPMAIDVVGNN